DGWPSVPVDVPATGLPSWRSGLNKKPTGMKCHRDFLVGVGAFTIGGRHIQGLRTLTHRISVRAPLSALSVATMLALPGRGQAADLTELDRATIDAAIYMDVARRCGLPTWPIERAMDHKLTAMDVDNIERGRLMHQMALFLALARQETEQPRSCDEMARFIKEMGREY